MWKRRRLGLLLHPHLERVEQLLALGLGGAGVAPCVFVGLMSEQPRRLAVAFGPLSDLEAENVTESVRVQVDVAAVLGGLVGESDKHLVDLPPAQHAASKAQEQPVVVSVDLVFGPLAFEVGFEQLAAVGRQVAQLGADVALAADVLEAAAVPLGEPQRNPAAMSRRLAMGYCSSTPKRLDQVLGRGQPGAAGSDEPSMVYDRFFLDGFGGSSKLAATCSNARLRPRSLKNA